MGHPELYGRYPRRGAWARAELFDADADPHRGYVKVSRVSSTILVTVERKRYPVTCHLADSKATIHLYADKVESVPGRPSLPGINGYWVVIKSVMTGNTLLRCLKEKLTPYASERCSPIFRCFLCNGCLSMPIFICLF
ncbi:MAG: hypothetical protein PHO08_14160 [Methylococcales bacterium]|nr:hypothetical protein [Methylococcales bacterium]MDD5632910.1 hypothetical protein [Methylococcales bacterium]